MSVLRGHAAVVGGSLSGLCAGLALARAGWQVTILERAAGEPPGGAGLGLDRGLLGRVTGVDATAIPVITGNRDSAAWGLVRQFLLDVTRRTPGIEFLESVTVTGVREPGGSGQVLDSTAGPFTADVIVGADGLYSVTRRFVVPEQPAASYAGYMLWRGLVSELDRFAQQHWPAPWGGGIGWGVTHGQVFGTPVAEYLPPRLVRERVALAGDAAHIASPMTGAGFQNALLDVAALAACLDSANTASVPAGLVRYEQERLPRARQLVSAGMSWGRSYLSLL